MGGKEAISRGWRRKTPKGKNMLAGGYYQMRDGLGAVRIAMGGCDGAMTSSMGEMQKWNSIDGSK